ncbi:MAG: hypothetical protein VW874_02670 [Gammaproteobacteria bacterium]
MPTFIKILWLIAIAGVAVIANALVFNDSPQDIKHAKLVSGIIKHVECSDGARSFMNKRLVIVDKGDQRLEFSKDDRNCLELEKELSQYSKFQAYQIAVPIFGFWQTVSLKLDDVEYLDFNEAKFAYNLSLLLSPLIVPFALAMIATYNWRRGRWRKT